MSSFGDAAAIVTAATAAIAVAGTYVQFVLKRSVLPSAEFDIQFVPLVREQIYLVGEVDLVFRNTGSAMLVVTGVRSRIRYKLANDAEMLAAGTGSEPSFFWKVPSDEVMGGNGLVSQPSSYPSPPSSQAPANLSATAVASDMPEIVGRAYAGWLELVQQRTFIQSGVTQHYRKPIALPANTQLIHIWGAFDYHIDMGAVTRFLIRWLATPPKNLDWRRGISNHTVRRTFFVPTVLLEQSSQNPIDKAPDTGHAPPGL